MTSSIWFLMICIAGSGALGGLVNAMMSENGFLLPKREMVDASTSIIRPGFIGNMIIGSVAATVSWGLYGPLAAYTIAGTPAAMAANAAVNTIGISLSALVGAVLVGIGGARWLTNEVDKNLLKAAASKAASAQPKSTAGQQIALASPAQALNIAKSL